MGVLTLIHIYKAPAHNRSCATQEDDTRMLQLQRQFACLDLCLSLLCAKSCYSHGSNMRVPVQCTLYTVHSTLYTVHCTVVIVQSKNATFMSSIFAAGLPCHHIYPLCSTHHPLYIFTAVNHQEQQGINAMKTQFTVGTREPNLLNMILFW